MGTRPPAPLPEIHLDPDAANRDKAVRRRRLNVVEYPMARLIGNSFVLAAVYLHNRFILGDVSAPGFAVFAAGLLGYSLVSWVVLAKLYDRVTAIDLGQLFLFLDVVAWTFAVYASGGERSWLFFLMLMRAADQRVAGPWRVLTFAHVSIASYAALIVYLAAGEGRAIAWPAEITKMLMMYAANVYMAFTALTTESCRDKLVAAVRVA